MDRRQFLAVLGAGSTAALAGCSGKKHPVKFQEEVTVSPGDYYAKTITVPKSRGPGYGLLYEVESNGKYDIFVFEADGVISQFENYKKAVSEGKQPEEDPDAIDRLSNAHVSGDTNLKRTHIPSGEFKFLIDNTNFQGKSGLHGHKATDSPINLRLKVDVVVNLPKWARDLG